MKVFVVNKTIGDPRDCILGVFLTIQSLKEFLDEKIFVTRGNWANMTLYQIQDWVTELGHPYIIHEIEAQ